MKEVYVTKEGLEELKARLEDLKSNKRLEVAAKIKFARELGDLSENAEYAAAKEEQGFLEQEIRELEEKVLHAVIIEESADKGSVSIGSTVKVLDVEFGDEEEYTIVGTTEADISSGKISNESPPYAANIGSNRSACSAPSSPPASTTTATWTFLLILMKEILICLIMPTISSTLFMK